MNSQYDLNPFYFHHNKVNLIILYKDGQSIHSKLLMPDFTRGNYIRAYHKLFFGFNHNNGIYITWEEFAKWHTLYAFNLSPDMCDGPHLNLQQQGTHELKIKFADLIKKIISILCVRNLKISLKLTKHDMCYVTFLIDWNEFLTKRDFIQWCNNLFPWRRNSWVFRCQKWWLILIVTLKIVVLKKNVILLIQWQRRWMLILKIVVWNGCNSNVTALESVKIKTSTKLFLIQKIIFDPKCFVKFPWLMHNIKDSKGDLFYNLFMKYIKKILNLCGQKVDV